MKIFTLLSSYNHCLSVETFLSKEDAYMEMCKNYEEAIRKDEEIKVGQFAREYECSIESDSARVEDTRGQFSEWIIFENDLQTKE